MANNRVTTVKITDDGMLPIPEEFRRELGLESEQTVQLTAHQDSLVVRALSQQEIGERIVALMKEAFSGFTWEEVKAERDRDDFWC
jgi:bifunctional DNA-binding transcriptional regulator/antitoxin component of YhaV-PrlF toxin-antitoxin module